MTNHKCIICGSDTHKLIDPQIKAEYDVCNVCTFIYKTSDFHLDFEEEQEQYDRHENSIENEGYVNIFKNLITDYINEINITRNILEFGSGPTPVFKMILEKENYKVYDFDPFYNPNEEYKNQKYQLITSNEVPEHFSDPMKEIEHLVDLLEPNGYILFSTHFRNMPEEEFFKWWYRRDPTHISFFNVKTFEYICDKFGLEIIKHDNKKTILFQKK